MADEVGFIQKVLVKGFFGHPKLPGDVVHGNAPDAILKEHLPAPLSDISNLQFHLSGQWL
jgi:hypothetical protein